MDSLSQALQPFFDIMHFLNTITFLVFIGIGVKAAFYFKSFFYGILLLLCLILLSSAFSQISPGLILKINHYLWALSIGWTFGKLVKWTRQYLLRV
jgi:hypothetical protein